MISSASSTRIFVAMSPTDMRKGFDGLQGLVSSVLGQDPLSGHLFLFVNRRRDKLKVLSWDGDGLASRHESFVMSFLKKNARVSAAAKSARILGSRVVSESRSFRPASKSSSPIV